MARYLTCLTWALLLALCYTPTPALPQEVGSLPDFHLLVYDGGVNADNPSSGVIIRGKKGSTDRIVPIKKGPPLEDYFFQFA
ncbi:hypothetical protein Hamer_G014911 [Homarus americanus]|uniref:Uncharacterized protein n=1 Tax=Homarus americanus TaxID=6706 RepID=A0A8J5JGW3_HOMAM|nr:hypothetical protein Hamer_G014911 [Homarus americanus]